MNQLQNIHLATIQFGMHKIVYVLVYAKNSGLYKTPSSTQAVIIQHRHQSCELYTESLCSSLLSTVHTVASHFPVKNCIYNAHGTTTLHVNNSS